MDRYAQVVVDIPVLELESYYDYCIPEEYKNKIEIGSVVKVPFGHRVVTGFVVNISPRNNYNKGKIKNIKDIIIKEPLFDKSMFKLLKWISDYYKSPLNKVIKTAVPTGLLKGNIAKKRVRYVVLNQSNIETETIIKKIENRAPKQAEILRILLNSDEFFTVSKLIKIAKTSNGTVSRLLDKGLVKYIEKVEERRPYLEKKKNFVKPLKPTFDQKRAINHIKEYIDNNMFGVFLLHGVTGSGKTEVYMQVIESLINKGKGAIVLVPEISLTPMMVKRFYSRFGEKVAVLHSNLSLGERYDEWRRLKRGEARIAVGARSAVFAPVKNLGIMIIDEEHENTYKQSESPYYHAREVSLKRGRLLNIPIILGSATPSLESYYRAKKGIYNYVELPKRVNRKELPPVHIVDMREELKDGNTNIFSTSLQEGIKKAIKNKEQVLIFLNRRGYSNFVLCRECGHVIKCKNCDISLTYHVDQDNLRCHYCDYKQKFPRICPECGSRYIKDFGIGTERIEEELNKLFPQVTVDRMDVDTTYRKGSHRNILEKFERGETDILVGTQMIAKGHDYPNVSVVGVITADTILNLPDFRSSERTFQLLTQVAGRTGRGGIKGQVIIQTYTPEHYSIQSARNHDYHTFYEREIWLRKKLFYPPFSYIVNILIKGASEDRVIDTAFGINQFLKSFISSDREILGPSPAPITKIKGNHRWQIILKFKDWRRRDLILTKIIKEYYPESDDEVQINIDVDPFKML